jgi:hypothetical protein
MVFDRDVVPLDEAGFLQALAERGREMLKICERCVSDKPDHRHRALLRTRHDWPRRHRAAEQLDELPPVP